ncbi:helix-turn-helix transcriptional regulator [Sphingosinicella sp. CPCC 101087]|uniref:helix-turn-helix transcriptional regulator n=1 Tax=Sphingosinicella sp. CPCC 101087 TaxID=2497754 RepID=UPI00101CFB84|nr:helix-turn-helix transcriptional regulator [Sphingosinicella sp. CPCC 101087]
MIAGSAIAWLEAEMQPRLIVDEELAILWANGAARQLLAEKCEVEERAGYLNALDPLHHERLVRVVRSGTDPLRTCCIPLSGSAGHLLIRCRPLGGHESHLCGLVLVRTDRRADVGYRDLETAFGLTPAEHRVLLSLLDGKEADRLTQEMGVSIETIRSHIRSFYAKLEVNSREQLFAKAQPFRV